MANSEYLRLSHNVSNLVYHFVCPAKYRRVVFDDTVDEKLKQICLGIELRYDWIHFLEIGSGQRSCTFFDTKHAELFSNKNNKDGKEHNSKANIC